MKRFTIAARLAQQHFVYDHGSFCAGRFMTKRPAPSLRRMPSARTERAVLPVQRKQHVVILALYRPRPYEQQQVFFWLHCPHEGAHELAIDVPGHGVHIHALATQEFAGILALVDAGRLNADCLEACAGKGFNLPPRQR
jgi:hypothetical protein